MASLEMNEDRKMLLRTARDVVRERSPVAALRALRDGRGEQGVDLNFWGELCELGLPALAWPEALGGSGLSDVELGLVVEELGRTLSATPLFASVILAGEALARAGTPSHKALLPQVAKGKLRLALAHTEGPHFAPWSIQMRADRTATGFVLNGQKAYVLDAPFADHVVVVARTAGSVQSSAGLSLFLVSRDTPGLTITRLGMVDSRAAGHVQLSNVAVGEAALVGVLDHAAEVLEPMLDRAAILLSAEMLGSASAAFELTLDYLKTRRQFGVLIGSFQALKHRAADLYAELALARSVVVDALCALDSGRDDRALVASATKARLSDLFLRVAAEGIQMHGGIGVTDEHDIGLYYKRARVAELLLGDASYHRDRFATLSGY